MDFPEINKKFRAGKSLSNAELLNLLDGYAVLWTSLSTFSNPAYVLVENDVQLKYRELQDFARCRIHDASARNKPGLTAYFVSHIQ